MTMIWFSATKVRRRIKNSRRLGSYCWSTFASPRDHERVLTCSRPFILNIGRDEAFRPNIGVHTIHQQWTDNEEITEKQKPLDHILIGAKHESNMIDVTTLLRLDLNNDHFLVRAKFHTRISIQKKSGSNQVPT